MKILFLEYPKCSTCVKAKKFLIENNIDFEVRHIVENNPNKEELKKLIEISKLPLKRFFNTSGMKYKELNIKDKFDILNEDELIDILASNGMLVKRPLIVCNDKVINGFSEDKYREFFDNIKKI